MLADKSHERDRYARAEASKRPRFDDHFDIMHVSEYARARGGSATSQQWLLDRLGKAITRRREFIRYCREHSEKIAAAPSLPSRDNPRHHDGRTLNESHGRRTTFAAPTRTGTSGPSAVHTSATTIIPAEMPIDDGQNTGDASTVASSVSFRQGPNALKIPDLGEFAMPGMPFECPYCGKLQQFRSTREWRSVHPATNSCATQNHLVEQTSKCS